MPKARLVALLSVLFALSAATKAGRETELVGKCDPACANNPFARVDPDDPFGFFFPSLQKKTGESGRQQADFDALLELIRTTIDEADAASQ